MARNYVSTIRCYFEVFRARAPVMTVKKCIIPCPQAVTLVGEFDEPTAILVRTYRLVFNYISICYKASIIICSQDFLKNFSANIIPSV